MRAYRIKRITTFNFKNTLNNNESTSLIRSLNNV